MLAGQLALPPGDHREAFVDADDIAAVAATALTGDGRAGRSYEVMGPRALSFPEALEVIGRAAGRSIRHRGTAEAYTARLESWRAQPPCRGAPVREPARQARHATGIDRRPG